jgi:selenocysteine-specific elongation factor
VSNDFYFNRESLFDLIEKLRRFAREKTADNLVDVVVFKELAGVSRKYAIPLLEHFDQTKITQRIGDKRKVL